MIIEIVFNIDDEKFTSTINIKDKKINQELKLTNEVSSEHIFI
jgi:hypothetical protein